MHISSPGTSRRTVAVIGSGVSGLTAAYLLQRRYDVTVFEADNRLGGHAHTHDVAGPAGALIPVDTGFIVHNNRTYPHLLRLFQELDVATQPAEMSMSVTCRGCGLEYAGARGFGGVFAQPASAARPDFLRMLAEIPAFHRRARRLLRRASNGDPHADEITLGGFLATHGHSPYFVNHFAIPLVSAVWSSGTDDALAYPARYLFEFLANHGMLSVSGSPAWRTVVGGSRRYVEKAAKGLTSVRTSTPVRRVRRHSDGVEIRDDADTAHRFDHVVIATHADQALRLLADPTPQETSVLGAFRSSVNTTVLHTDTRFLPTATRARASWNYDVPSCRTPPSTARPVTVTYDLTRLQRLDEGRDLGDDDGTAPRYLVTLGAEERIRPDTVIERMVYEHPVFTRASVAAQRALPDLATSRTVFAGAWHGWGFHEDGCLSGVKAAAQLGVIW